MARDPVNYLDEEGLAFEEAPDAFVLLHRGQIVWTVRGIRHFRPRFDLIGINIADVRTVRNFRQALDRWNVMERQLLVERIESRASASGRSLTYQCLWAVLSNAPDASALVTRLQGNAGRSNRE